jgi:hypothetical protein
MFRLQQIMHSCSNSIRKSIIFGHTIEWVKKIFFITKRKVFFVVIPPFFNFIVWRKKKKNISMKLYINKLNSSNDESRVVITSGKKINQVERSAILARMLKSLTCFLNHQIDYSNRSPLCLKSPLLTLFFKLTASRNDLIFKKHRTKQQGVE